MDEEREAIQDENAPPKKPKHKATYSSDKKTGGYLVRVTGPTAAKFAGREVPVTTKAGKVTKEKLERLIWSGPDKTTGEPCALYKFASKPRDDAEEAEF